MTSPARNGRHAAPPLTPDAPADGAIVLDRVSKSYEEGGRSRTVLHEVSATFAPGEFVVLLGRSGSGKSTLLNLVSGIDTPTSGEVHVAGRSLTRLSERERTLFRRRSIGFIFQFYNLVPTLTVLENLLLPLELNGGGGAKGRAAALDLLAQVGLADRRDTPPDRLSGGEQQRVAVARALAHDPELILADEPTGNLDAETGQTVLELLGRLLKERGKTLLVATHSQDLVSLADRVLDLTDGRLVERRA